MKTRTAPQPSGGAPRRVTSHYRRRGWPPGRQQRSSMMAVTDGFFLRPPDPQQVEEERIREQERLEFERLVDERAERLAELGDVDPWYPGLRDAATDQVCEDLG